MDAVVHYQAESVKARKIPFREVAWQLRLDHGVMTIDPLSFVHPEGNVSARVRIDASRDVPDIAVDARLTSVRLSQFRPKGSTEPPLDGTLLGRIAIRGRGRSVHAAASTADGVVTAAVPHGEIREALAELTGINVARALGLLLTKSQDKASIRCGVADFLARDGILDARNLLFDTDNVLITGKGDIDLRSEKLDLTIYGRPKKLRLFRVKSPIAIRGPLLKPSIGLKSGNTPGQAGLAAAAGALVTPLAAVLAFVDPGLEKDADCGALLAEAKQHGVPLKQATGDQQSKKASMR
jgi:uncharacterized protein involved in outer membrane biogenesis